MSGFDANSLLREATERLQSNDFHGALERVDSALALDRGLAEGWMLRGVALSGLGRKGEASEAFQQALSLEPLSVKIRYNFAVHLHRAGELDGAARLLEEILQAEPGHEQAKALLATVRAAASAAGQSGFGYAPPPPQTPYRMAPPPDEPAPRAHAVRFVENMGPAWTALGVALMLLSLAVFVYVLVAFGPRMMEQLQLAMRDPEAFRKAQEAGQVQQAGGLGLTLFSWAVRLGLFGWMAVDIADRRGSWLWFAPVVLLCCCGLEGLAALLYLGLGRRKLG
ncbi:MAG: tetratricopeptide repeat protein [Fimbriimonadales bacterium]|nr:tetratricopeptide repeat protein [Fimbriimonadales bacterium]